MWLTAIVCLAVGILSGMGVGSAGLLVVYLTWVEHLPQLTAQGLNLFFFLFSSGTSLVVHLLRTPLLYTCILLLLIGGIPGALLGSSLALHLPGDMLRRLFGWMLIASGSIALFKRKRSGNVARNSTS